MADASASAASTAASQTSGGNITVNPPNYLLYIVLGLVLAFLGFKYLSSK